MAPGRYRSRYRTASVLRRDFAFQPRLLHYAYEDIFHRELPDSRLKDVNPIRFEFLSSRPHTAFRVLIRDDVKPVAEQRNPPPLHLPFQEVRRALWLIHDELQQMTGLLNLEVARAAFGHELARDHHTQAVALLGLFEVVRGHEYRGAGVGQAVDHFPESAARQRVDPGGRFVEEEYAGLVHDGRAEGDTLLPSSGQTAGDLTPLAFEPRKREYPALFLFALLVGHTVDAREEIQVLFYREVVVERKLLRHIADLLAHGA